VTRAGVLQKLTINDTVLYILNVTAVTPSDPAQYYVLEGLSNPLQFIGQKVTVSGTLVIIDLDGVPFHVGIRVKSITEGTYNTMCIAM
jgi:hypothetical protein